MHCLGDGTDAICGQLYSRRFVQALALEKLLLVTSTVPQTSAPPPLPHLSSLPAVNENPLTPAVPPPTKGGLASTASPHTNRTSDRPQFPASGFGVAGAVLGTLTAGAASQFLPGTQVRRLVYMRRLWGPPSLESRLLSLRPEQLHCKRHWMCGRTLAWRGMGA